MITDLEKGAFLKLFNRGGCVLDFSTSDFDTFTMRSVGIALCAKYGLSKGKSLQAYLLEADQKSVVKLLKDLFDYYEMNFRPEFDEACQSDFSSFRHEKGMKQYYLICKPVIDRECAGDMHLNSSCEYIKQEFSSDFLNGQIDLMMTMRVENPTEAIGKAKELIESCCKTILERGGVAFDKSWTLSQLTKETMKLLHIASDDLEEGHASKNVRQILGSLNGLASGITEFRNEYGSGHGKSASFKPLPVRHAKLAVGCSITLVEYLWETYEWRKQEGKIG